MIALLGIAPILGSLLVRMTAVTVLGGLNQTWPYKIMTTYRNKTLYTYEKVFKTCELTRREA